MKKYRVDVGEEGTGLVDPVVRSPGPDDNPGPHIMPPVPSTPHPGDPPPEPAIPTPQTPAPPPPTQPPTPQPPRPTMDA